MALRAGWKRAQLGKSPSVLAGSPSLLDQFRAELAGSLLASYGFSALGVKFHPSYLSIGKRLLRFGFLDEVKITEDERPIMQRLQS